MGDSSKKSVESVRVGRVDDPIRELGIVERPLGLATETKKVDALSTSTSSIVPTTVATLTRETAEPLPTTTKST